jgi:hypothetical protein
MRTKEFLLDRNVSFESFDVVADPAAMARLVDRNILTVPVVVKGDRWAHGVQLDDVSALLGWANTTAETLPPDDLWSKFGTVVGAAARFIAQVPDQHLGYHPPDRPRTTRDLAFHIFLIADGYIDAVEGDGLSSPTDISYPAPANLRTGLDLAAHGERLLARMARWWSSHAGSVYDTIVPTYYGPQREIDLLERSTWHAAQHTRQLMMYLERCGIEPDGPLTDDDLAGLPLPSSVWH